MMIILALLHVLIICLSNMLVQCPLMIGGFHTTYGVFSYPFIFILTDLTARALGPKTAKKTIYMAMFPAFLVSYIISNFYIGNDFLKFNVLVFRIAFASFSAYVLGQLLDIYIFQRFRNHSKWWTAPAYSSIFGNIFDTYCFFFIAFYQAPNLFLSSHWMEIASIDLIFKLTISVISLIPLYGLILRFILSAKLV